MEGVGVTAVSRAEVSQGMSGVAVRSILTKWGETGPRVVVESRGLKTFTGRPTSADPPYACV